MEERRDRFTAIENRFAGYEVYDQDYEKIGKVDDLFVDENDIPEYIGVKMGLLGTRSTLIPMDIVRVNDERHLLQVAADKDTVKDGPTYDDDQEITPEFENEVYSYYGLQQTSGTEERGSYSEYSGDSGRVGPGMYEGDTETGEFRGHPAEDEGVHQSHGSDLEDEDELRVQRSEEELRAGVREREAGQVSVRKRVRTERERIAVPKKREEVSVERTPVDREAGAGEIGEDEVSVPVVEEEVVVDKRPVVKEEIRVKKDVVEDEEVVEEEVRKEEVDVDDASGRRTDRDV